MSKTKTVCNRRRQRVSRTRKYRNNRNKTIRSGGSRGKYGDIDTLSAGYYGADLDGLSTDGDINIRLRNYINELKGIDNNRRLREMEIERLTRKLEPATKRSPLRLFRESGYLGKQRETAAENKKKGRETILKNLQDQIKKDATKEDDRIRTLRVLIERQIEANLTWDLGERGFSPRGISSAIIRRAIAKTYQQFTHIFPPNGWNGERVY